LSFVLARLLDPLSAALERADRGAAAIRLALRLTNRAVHTRVLQLPAPMRDARVLRTLLLLDLESGSPFGGASEGPSEVMIDIVSIELDPAPARITQFSLLERALPSPETLSTLTARLSALVGESRIGSAVLLDSHRPDAFAMVRFAPEVGETGLPPNERRPVLRRQRLPPAIRVSVEHGRPVYIATARRGMPQGAVIQAAGPWRTSGGWWSTSGAGGWGPGYGAGEGGLVPPKSRSDEGLVPPKSRSDEGLVPPKSRSDEGGWNRDEWDVALNSGVVCRIYQDRMNERWFLEGTYD
jgi:protein ImuB